MQHIDCTVDTTQSTLNSTNTIRRLSNNVQIAECVFGTRHVQPRRKDMLSLRLIQSATSRPVGCVTDGHAVIVTTPLPQPTGRRARSRPLQLIMMC
jgi:hypothetical protein